MGWPKAVQAPVGHPVAVRTTLGIPKPIYAHVPSQTRLITGIDDQALLKKL